MIQSTIEQKYEENKKLIFSMAKKHSRLMKWEYDDLVGKGNLAFMQTNRDFDPTRGVKFSTFLYHKVYSQIYSDNPRKLFHERKHTTTNSFNLVEDRKRESTFSLNNFSFTARKVIEMILDSEEMDSLNKIRLALKEKGMKNDTIASIFAEIKEVLSRNKRKKKTNEL